MTAETILDIFEPPEDRVAHSAVIVAMTGTRDFLEDSLVRFTGLKGKQRAELGITNTYLLLDAQTSSARTRVFAPHELPGLHELQPRDIAPVLLHAKLALLGFARTRMGEPTNLRLAILTANFTYTCAKNQLELAWVVDIALDEHATALERADVAAAASFVDELIKRRYHLPERDLGKKERVLTSRLDTLLKTCIDLEPDRTKSGFVHSLDEPLYPQIRTQMKRLRTSSPRNFLLCGSGFYEDPGKKADKPTVLAKLEDLGGFTSNVRRVVIAEPKMAGALAPWALADAVEGWQIFTPQDPLGAKRTLHAKFIYTGWLRKGVASNGCLYLGSGNLSRRGLLSAGSQAKRKQPSTSHDGVNIECGIVIAVDDRLTPDDLEARFFWRDGEPSEDFDEWEPGTGPDDEIHEQIVASPILLARVASINELALEWRDDAAGEIFAIRLGETWAAVTAPHPTVSLPKVRLDVLHVRNATETQEWIVPVIDAIGRTCWVPPTFATYDDALAALLDFPIRPAEASGEDDDDDNEDDEPDVPDGDGTRSSKESAEDHAKGYALHAAAELLEQTAALQRSLEPNLIDDWLDHIERFFHASFPKELIEIWKTHRIDVFTHLARVEFRPSTLTPKQLARYASILDGVARAWGLR